jgi:hypothetical protein
MGSSKAMGIAMRWGRAAAVALLLVGSSAPSFAGDDYALVVTGASGGEPYATKYAGWRQSFVSMLRTKFGYPDDHVIVMAEHPGAGIRTATRDEVRRALIDLRGRLGQDDQLVVLLIGHGTTADGSGPGEEDAKFNLVGPDLRASEFADLLRPLTSRVIFIDTTAVSFPFLRRLAGPGRIVVTATDSSAQEFETSFGEFFVRAFADPSADADKNGRVSLFEAFMYASAATRAWYEQRGQLPTERPLIDDDGDGVGHEAWTPGSDGALARATFLQPPSIPVDEVAAASAKRQRELESRIEDLKRRRASMLPAEYEAELERLLLELARVSVRERQQ